ncbi:MAG: hypothetical protein CMP25_02170 [Rickettsiales bacterium]|nr:hypothetical protein [Rickettsiales bacterium]|tara:strand:+ start:508 stop:1455 length:948 start_codon:yes stop_codon:yes gene_type:complete
MKISSNQKILIIKFGGLGDFILSLSAMYTIKTFYKKSKLVLVTESAYKDIAERSKWFEEIIIIKRSMFYFLDKLKLKKKLNTREFVNVYDLQTSKRSTSYGDLFDGKITKWSGILRDSVYFHLNPKRDTMHTIDRQKEQLKIANIKKFSKFDENWIFDDKFKHNFKKKRFVILVVGGSARRKNKRIPFNVFVEIAKKLFKKNIDSIIVGGNDELELCQEIKKKFPYIINLCGKLDVYKLASLSRDSLCIVGNDTGPMHVCALAKKKLVVFFTKFSNPKLCAPVGSHVTVLNYNNECFQLVKKTLSIILEKKTITF